MRDSVFRYVYPCFERHEFNGVDALRGVPVTAIREYNRYRRAPPATTAADQENHDP